jgi:hypothetical protein
VDEYLRADILFFFEHPEEQVFGADILVTALRRGGVGEFEHSPGPGGVRSLIHKPSRGISDIAMPNDKIASTDVLRCDRAVIAVLAVVLLVAAAKGYSKWRDASNHAGQKYAQPFRIAGSLYYVGATPRGLRVSYAL